MTRIGVRAFRTISDLFELQDNQSIGDLDLNVASTVYEIGDVLKSSLARLSRMTKTISATAAANPNDTALTIRDASSWTTFSSTVGAVDIPDNHVLQIVGMSVFVEVAANFTSAVFLQREVATSRDLGIQAWGSSVIIDGVAFTNLPQQHYGSVPFELVQLGFQTRFQVNVTGNTDVTLLLDVVSGPKGLFGYPASV